MTPTNRLPAIEALGEALAALEGKREAFREQRDDYCTPFAPHREIFESYLLDAHQAIQHLANSGWTLTPGPTVNAGEEVAPGFHTPVGLAARQAIAVIEWPNAEPLGPELTKALSDNLGELYEP